MLMFHYAGRYGGEEDKEVSAGVGQGGQASGPPEAGRGTLRVGEEGQPSLMGKVCQTISWLG